MSARWLLCVIALACAACQVGDPLVDVLDAEPAPVRLSCNMPPGCMPVTRGEAPELEAIPVRIACEQTCVWQTGSGTNAHCPASSLDKLPSRAHCMNVALQLPAGSSELRVDDADWQDVNIPLRTQHPLTVTLQGGTLQRVYLELEGPITLRMKGLTQFDDLRISARSSTRVELAAAAGNELSVISQGELTITAGMFENVDVQAESFTAESAIMKAARLHASMITLTDVTFERGLVETKHALWSAFVATDAALRFCGDARLIAGHMARCAISTCEGSSVRLYNDSFGSGSLDGDFELSGSNVENSQIAPASATRLFAYGSAFNSVNLCEHTGLVVFGAGSWIKCSACADTLIDNLPVCAVETPDDKWLENYCPGWIDEADLPLCADGTPTQAHRAR